LDSQEVVNCVLPELSANRGNWPGLHSDCLEIRRMEVADVDVIAAAFCSTWNGGGRRCASVGRLFDNAR
jgi:hypothetical protein